MSEESNPEIDLLTPFLWKFDDDHPKQSDPFLMGRQVAVLLAIFKYQQSLRQTKVHKDSRYLNVLQKNPLGIARLVVESGRHLEYIRSKRGQSRILWEDILDHINRQFGWLSPPRLWGLQQATQAIYGFSQQSGLNDLILNELKIKNSEAKTKKKASAS